VIVPPFAPENDVEAILERVDGVVLSGGPDIHPCLYGQEEHAELGPTDLGLDRFELCFVRRALERDLPLLGICRGAELLNVARGGTLIQHVEGHRQTEEARIPTHDVRVEEGSRLAEALSCTTAGVNSFHHQAVARLGRGLKPVAWSPDGVVEAVEATGRRFCVGVQWHPEEGVDHRLFAAHVAAAR
jgi:gamma-glutamyl-gamma-aminobutyrate hydrolase PuuD